jgi:hypothetical protein
MNNSQIVLNNAKQSSYQQSKTKDVEYDLLDLAIQTLATLGFLALPIIFIEYVRSRVQHELKTASKAK